MTHLIQQTVLGIQFWSVKCTPATARYAKISSHCNPPHQAFLKWLDYMKTKHFKMFLNVFSASYIYLFKLFSISIVLLLKNNLTNICSKISKIGVNLWMLNGSTCNMKSSGTYTKEGKKVNVLCIVDQNHERSALDHFRKFKGI